MPQISPGQQNVSVNPNTGKSFGAIPDLSVNDDTSLQQIQDNYKQIGSDYNQMAAAAAENVGARQRALIGNDFGATNPYMYDTYYEPGANSMASAMRMEGTQQAFEVGMDRGKKAAEQAVKDAKDKYSNAVDAYNNAANQYQQQLQQTYKNPQIAYFDAGALGDGTETSELLSYANLQGKSLDDVIGQAVNGDTNYSLVKDWGEVGKSERRTAATNATLSQFGHTREEYDKWGKAKQDEFWGRSDVGNYWSKTYADSYIKDHYSQDVYAKYQDSYNKTVEYLTKAYDYAIGKIDKLDILENDTVCLKKVELEMPEAIETDAPAATLDFDKDNNQYVYHSSGEKDGQTISLDDIKSIVDRLEGKDKEVAKKAFIDPIDGSVVSPYYYNQNDPNVVRGKEILMREFAGEDVDKKKVDVVTRNVDVDDFIKKTMGVDIQSLQQLRHLQNEDPDKYNTLIHQAASVISGANAIDIADGEKWYLTNKGYEQLPAGTAVMFTLPGTMDAEGNIIDEDLKSYLNIVKDYNDTTIARTDEDRKNLEDEARKAYERYAKHMQAALMWESGVEATTSADAYRTILYRSDPAKYRDLVLTDGRKISDVIEEWSKKAQEDPEWAYRRYAELTEQTFQEVGGLYVATPQFMGKTEQGMQPIESGQGFSTIGKEGTDAAGEVLTEEDASVLWTILSTSIEQYNKGNEDGNINPKQFMDKDTSGWLENAVVKTAKGVETLFDLASNVLATVGRAGASVITGEWDKVLTGDSLSFQQLVDATAVPFTKDGGPDWDAYKKQVSESKGTSWGTMFNEVPDESSWHYYYDVRNLQQENLADVTNPLVIDALTGDISWGDNAQGLGINVTSRGVAFWANPTAFGNFTSGIADMVVNNLITGGIESVVGGAIKSSIKSAAASASDNIMMALGSKALSQLDDIGRSKMLAGAVDAVSTAGQYVDDAVKASKQGIKSWTTSDLSNALLHAYDEGGRLTLDYSDDFVRAVSIMANGSDDAYKSINTVFKNSFKEAMENADDVAKAGLKQSLEANRTSITDVASLIGNNVAREVYKNMTINSFTGATAEVLQNVPDSVKEFATKAIASNTARNGVDAVAITTASGARATVSAMIGTAYHDAVQYVGNMSREGVKKTLNELFEQSAKVVSAGGFWGSDDTVRFLSRRGWNEMRTGLLRKEWMLGQAENMVEDIVRGYTEPVLTNDGYQRETVGEYLSNPMNYIMAGTSGLIVHGGKKIFNRVQLARTVKSLDKAMSAYTAAGNIDPNIKAKTYNKINNLEAKATKLMDKALDAGCSYDQIQKLSSEANDILNEAQAELNASFVWDTVKSKGGKWKTKEEFYEAIKKNPGEYQEDLFFGAKIATAKAMSNYRANSTALGKYTGGLASIEDRKTLARMYQLMHSAKVDNAAEIQAMKIPFWEKQKLMYNAMRDAVVSEYGKLNGVTAGLDEFFARVMATGKDLVDKGEIDINNMRLGYLPVDSLFNTGDARGEALRGLHAGGMNILDSNVANPTITRGIDEDDLVQAYLSGKYEDVVLHDMDGKIIMQNGEPKKYQLNPDGLKFLDRLTCYQNGVEAHRFLDPILGKTDADVGRALLNNKSIIVKAPKASQEVMKNDMTKVNKDLNDLRTKLNKKYSTEAGKDVDFMQDIKKLQSDAEKSVSDTLSNNKTLVEENVKLNNKVKSLEADYANVEKNFNSDNRYVASKLFHDLPDEELDSLIQSSRDNFMGIVEAYTNGDYKSLSDRAASLGEKANEPYIVQFSTGDKMFDLEVTDSFDHAIREMANNGGEIPQDALVYLMMHERYSPQYKMEKGVKIYDEVEAAPTQKKSTKKDTGPVGEWEAKRVKGFKNDKGYDYTRGELNKIKLVTNSGEVNAGGLAKASAILEKRVLDVLPAGANADRVSQAVTNYANTLAKDMIAADPSFNFGDLIGIYDRISPDVELFTEAQKSGLLKKLVGFDSADITIDELSDHLGFLETKARALGSDDLADIEAANNLVNMIREGNNRAKNTEYKLVLEGGWDDEEASYGYSGPVSDIYGRPSGASYDASEQLGLPKVGDYENVLPDIYTISERNYVEKGIESLNKILEDMSNVRSKKYVEYDGAKFAKRKTGIIEQKAKANDILKDINNEINKAYHSGSSKELKSIVDNEVELRLQRQKGYDKAKKYASGNDFLEAIGIARIDDTYSPVTRNSEYIRAIMARSGEGDLSMPDGYTPEYSQRRLEASTTKGHMEQALRGIDTLEKLTNKKYPELKKRVNELLVELPTVERGHRDIDLDNIENSLAFALGNVENKKSVFTPDQLASATSGSTRKVGRHGDMEMSFDTYKTIRTEVKDKRIVKLGKRDYIIESGYDNGVFDLVVYRKNDMEPIDLSPEGGLSKGARENMITRINEMISEREDLKANKVNISKDGKVIWVEADDTDPEAIREGKFDAEYDPETPFMGNASKAQYMYSKYLGSAYSLDGAEKQHLQKQIDVEKSHIRKEIDDTKKQIKQNESDIRKTAKVKTFDEYEDSFAKKYLNNSDYKKYKNLLDKQRYIGDYIANGDGQFYNSYDGATFVGDTNGLEGYVTLENRKKLFGWTPDSKQLTTEELEKLGGDKSDKKLTKKMRGEMNKNLRSGNIVAQKAKDFDIPKTMDAKSKGLSLNQLLDVERQVQDIIGPVDASNIYISKDMAEMLTKISEYSTTPSKFGKMMGSVSSINKWFQEQQMAGGASWVNALTITQLRDVITNDPKMAVEYFKMARDVKNSAAVRNFVFQNSNRLSQIMFATGDDTILTDLAAAVSRRPGVEDGGVCQTLTSRALNTKGDWKGPKSIRASITGTLEDVFNDPTFQMTMPVLRAKKLILEYDNAVRMLKKHMPDLSDAQMAREAARFAYSKTELFFHPQFSFTKMGYEGFMDYNDMKVRRDFMAKMTGSKKTKTFMDAGTEAFFALRYKLMLTGRSWSGIRGLYSDIKGGIKNRGILDSTAGNIDALGTQFMMHGAANGLYAAMATAGLAIINCLALGIPTAWDDISFTDPIDNEFRIPPILQKFQTIGQIWMPNAYDPETGFYVDASKPINGLDTMSSTYTLQNSIFKTIDRMTNDNAYARTPQRGLPFLGVSNPVNKVLNTPVAKAIGDELVAANLLSPYKAMYEVVMDTTYFGNNIWEKKYLPDGSENKNYNPMRNITASALHLLNLDWLKDERASNRYVKGLNDKGAEEGGKGIYQDRTGTVGGSGILQHEFVGAAVSIINGDYLEGIVEGGEMPIKSKNLASQARTEFNNTVKNTVAQYMSEYRHRIEGASNDEKDNIYADVVKKCADTVARWSEKWDRVLGDDQSLVPYVTRTLMALTAGEYDDNLDYVQNAYWKAENIANIEHGSWSWMNDEELDKWIAEGHTIEDFNEEKQRRVNAYNQALDDEYAARQALISAGYDPSAFEKYGVEDLRSEQRNVNKKIFVGIQKKLQSPIGEFKNMKEMKGYYEQQIAAATTTKQKAKIADQYNKYVTDIIAPYANEYGEAVINDAYYNGQGLANTLAEYIILPADKYYRGKSPRASYLKDLMGVGYRDKSNLPSDDEVLELFTNVRKQIQKGSSASASAMLDRVIDQIKKGQAYASDADYSKIVRLKALLSARSK